MIYNLVICLVTFSDTALETKEPHLNESIPEIWRRSTCLWWGQRETEALRLHHPAQRQYTVKKLQETITFRTFG